MKILDESGNPITGTPDFSTGRYLQNSDGDLVFTKYTDTELEDIKKQEESDPIVQLQIELEKVQKVLEDKS
ncbi:MAG: hypothetical protein LKJ50_05550 [Clostridiales bacterium]|jgi:hypothetical protein|nr:hypothetical protein [Clostridiales bacterium]MCI1961747.1 hypothetical protein [Clostridiales bacterium]MCI2021844.1 hypothetical protein [Clostridiales bacterium]MCI2026141.1 hypothetical protein [Clostridiales bacterium]